MRTVKAMMGLLVAAWLAGCGGGGGGGGDSASCKSTMANPSACAPKLQLALLDAAGATTTQVKPGEPGTLRLTLVDGNNVPITNTVVTFSSTESTAVLVPASGTTLTDSTGKATLGLGAGTQAGAYTITATATSGFDTVRASLNYSVAYASLVLAPMNITPSTLSAGGTAGIAVTLNHADGQLYTPAQSVAFTSPCVAAGKATLTSPAITVNGVATTAYTDAGCGGADTITATTVLGGASFTRTGSVTVRPASAGQVVFVSALPQNISLKGTGGAGRQENSRVTFRVLDKDGKGIAGTVVDFTLTTTVGGILLDPATGTTDAEGQVATTVFAGIVNTPVRVLATTRDGTLSTVSDQLVISTGIPDQNSFTASPSIYNIECRSHDGTEFTEVGAYVADHFNNPVPDGTAVSFTTEGGAVDASCLTGQKQTTLTTGQVITQKGTPGQCVARFICQNPRPADGRITVLSYALGEESFKDSIGAGQQINRHELGETYEDLGEPFRYDRAITDAQAKAANLIVAPATTRLATPAADEPYIDSNGNNGYDSAGDGVYNGVLQTPPPANPRAVHVRQSFVLVFSGSEAVFTPLSPTPIVLDHCVDGTKFINQAKTFIVAVRDANPTVFPGNTMPGNILPFKTTIEFASGNGTVLTTPIIVPNTNEPNELAWTYAVDIVSDASQDPDTLRCSNSVSSGSLVVKVTTPLGIVTRSQGFTVND